MSENPRLREWDFRTVIAPSLIFFGLLIFIGTSAYLFFLSEQSFISARREILAHTMAQGLRNEIKNRVGALNFFGAVESVDIGQKNYEAFAKELIENFSSFYAINLISPDGVIKRVYPVEPNVRALGQNLFEREDVRAYLESSRDERKPKMSHRLMTYQQLYAFVLYVPLYDPAGKFLGWLNGVVDSDSWLLGFMAGKDVGRNRVRLLWENHPESTIDQGVALHSDMFRYSFEILNQPLQIEVGFSRSPGELSRARFYIFMLGLGCALLLMTTFFYVKMSFAKNKLSLANSQLYLKNSLLSSVTHDIANPLLALNLNLESVLHDESQQMTPVQRKRAARSLKKMGEMLNGARVLHARGMGLEVIATEPVNLKDVLKEALREIQDHAQSKKIEFEGTASLTDVWVQAEPKTLVNNVLSNVLTNALKFSPPGGKVKIGVTFEGEQVNLFVEDEGQGLAPDKLAKFTNASYLHSEKGTLNEPGTGLGLLQIRIFMQAYGGFMTIENVEPHGARVTLQFRQRTQTVLA